MFTIEQYKNKLAELIQLKDSIHLDTDPVASGLHTFNTKLAEIQSCRERVTALVLESLWNKAEAQRLLHVAQEEYDTAVANILNIDETVKNLRSSELRMAKVNAIVIDKLAKLKEAERLFNYSETFLKSVQAIARDVESKNENLIHQIFTVRMMLNIDPAMREEVKLR